MGAASIALLQLDDQDHGKRIAIHGNHAINNLILYNNDKNITEDIPLKIFVTQVKYSLKT
jgi:hypothetical protein